jgi:hypothetical protein
MATYRFRLIDKHGELIAVEYLSFESDAEAKQHADTMVGEYERVEVWSGENLIYAAMQRLR